MLKSYDSALRGIMGRCYPVLLGLTFSTALAALIAQARSSSSIEQRREAFNKLVDEEWQYELRESPEGATALGDYRYNDKWSDPSAAHQTQQAEELKQFLARFEAVNATGFPEQERFSKELMIRDLKDNIEAYELRLFEMPVDQFHGIQLQLAQFAALVPHDSVKHYEDYLTRLHALPAVIDKTIEVMRQGQRDRLMPPKYLLEKVVEQCLSIAAPAGMDNPFAQPLAKFPDAIPDVDQTRIRKALIASVDNEVRPAYRHFAEFIRTEYAPSGRTEMGVWALPNGGAIYQYYIRSQTTTDMSADEIYKLGLEQVAESEREEDAIARKLGAKDLKTFRQSLKSNPQLFAASREQFLDLYRKYIAQMEPELPKLFGLLPKSKLEIVPIERFREEGASAAEYVPGAPDGSRPGRIYVNTGKYQQIPIPEVEHVAYHEGIPGHHMQMSIAQNLPDLPPFRQNEYYAAYTEGWAFYAERLGRELGFYSDPYSEFGRLNAELGRACRLVVDTGVHAKRWTRDQMLEFFREHSGDRGPDVQSEVDRYIAVPGQALAYKLGQLKFLELRQLAKDQLGPKFDIRAFHDEMLNGGALPLYMLEVRTKEWIAKQKAIE